MRIGEARHRVNIQEKQTTPDDGGGYAETWVNVNKIWAKIEALRGTERFEAQQIQAEVSYKLTTRYTDIDPSMRFEYNGTVYEIESILPDNTLKKELEILCEVIR
jgi:SPP1 family predicted phage head-tail adaptor